MEKQRRIEKREVGAAVLLGPTRAHLLAILLVGKLHSLNYSRDAEERADLTGSDVCAETGYNPWGLVWLFQDFTNAKIGQVPELLSDHPNDQHRVDALERHFRKNPELFGKFDPDKKYTLFRAPKCSRKLSALSSDFRVQSWLTRLPEKLDRPREHVRFAGCIQ